MAGEDGKRARSTSRSRTSRPTTPLRPSSRSSFRESAREGTSGDAPFPLNAFEPAFAELSDAMADLEANMMHFQIMHESLARFSESFASFMYGLNMNAFCVDFPEGPIPESFRRMKQQEERQHGETSRAPERTELEGETTFMTTDTSFVENPTSMSRQTPKRNPSVGRQSRVPAPPTSTRGGPSARGGRGGTRGSSRPSGLVKPRARGIK
ncbi:DASH complex subunit Dam1 domain containing protein [Rhypophila decipiens]